MGIVFQNAESQILSTTVEDEVAFGPMNLGLPPGEMVRRVRTALQAVGLSGYETRNVEELSAGEKHRLTLASVLSMEPPVFLLDEPTAQLDRKGKEALGAILQGLKERKYAIVVADHDVRPYQGVADRFLFMKNGRIEDEPSLEPVRSQASPCRLTEEGVRLPRPDAHPLIGLSKVCFSRTEGASRAFGPFNRGPDGRAHSHPRRQRRGEVNALQGDNGPPATGLRVSVRTREVPSEA